MVTRNYINIEAGWRSPQIQIQITPLCWGLGLSMDRKMFGFTIGPVSIVAWYMPTRFEYRKDRRGFK